MEYRNPKIDHEVNVATRHPLKSFFKLFTMAALLAIIIIVVLSFSSEYLLRFVPFEFETAIADRLEITKVEPSDEQAFLQGMADRIIAQAQAPEEIKIRLHYLDENTVNAFATLGGNVFFFKGLVQKLQTEQALAMVMAHEIAHIVNRDPITALGRGLSTAIILSAVFGSSDNALIRRFIGSGETLTSLKYSRDDESRADKDGYDWVYRLYGHGCGTDELFALFENPAPGDDNPLMQFFTTHPHASSRLARIRALQNNDCGESDPRISPNPLYNPG